MATKFGYKRDAVRIKATKLDGNCMPDTRKFSVDPQITTYDVLRSIITKAFDIQQSFTISYRVVDDYNQETYLPLMSDWDLDAAFLRAAEPCLCLRIETQVYEEVGEEWDSSSNSFSWITESKIPLRLQGLFMNHVEKTMNMVKGAFSFIEDIQQAQELSVQVPRPPLTDIEFRKYQDPVGQVIKPEEFRNAIYFGGVEPGFRKVVWKHLLNVYPKGLSGRQRIEYMQRKAREYEQLKSAWKNVTNDDQMKSELSYVTSMVKKDVLRTDRHHHFYAGSDDNQNIVSLFNILTTYALNHPSVSYCQGMSDLASPLLVTMGNEAHAYICFCSLMRRLSSNFLLDGVAMTQKFQHLSDGLLFYDPTFYAYLKAHQADDLLFCYRWLLLEMKREFAFDDALRMLEVMWSSLPPSTPLDDLPLYEIRLCPDSLFPPPPSPLAHETPYSKVCALRRKNSSWKVLMVNRSLDESVIAKRRLRSIVQSNPKKFNSLDDGTAPVDRPVNTKLFKAFNESVILPDVTVCASSSSDSDSSKSMSYCFDSSKQTENDADSKEESDVGGRRRNAKIVRNLNEFLTLEKKISNKKALRDDEKRIDNQSDVSSSSSNSSPDDSSDCYPLTTTSMTQKLSRDLENLEKRVFEVRIDEGSVNKSNVDEVFVWENPLQYDVQNRTTINSTDPRNRSNVPINGDVAHEAIECNPVRGKEKISLPSPSEFGCGNPFLMFLCIAVLCQHRDAVMKSAMDYNEIAMHFDKMVRKHNVTRVLNQARILYAAYLKQHKQNFLLV